MTAAADRPTTVPKADVPVPEVAAATLAAAERELPGLGAMLAELEAAAPLWRPSTFWDHHNAIGLEMIAERGFGEFKASVNTTYFQWEPGSPFARDARGRVTRQLLRRWLRHPGPRPLTARLERPERSLHTGSARRWHALAVATAWDEARRADRIGGLAFEEPALGSPPFVLYRGRRVSEDQANSTLELAAVAEAAPERWPPRGTVLEIGGGYGRIAWLALRLAPELRYVVCDIPPALAIAQRYLTEVFPDLPAFRFRSFASGEEVADEIAAARLVFLTPNQLELLAPLGASLAINVSSLHEMRRDQIDATFAQLDRHCDGLFYSKQWERSLNVFDGIVVQRDDYPVPAGWRTLLDRPVPTTPGFFEAVYATRGDSAAPVRRSP